MTRGFAPNAAGSVLIRAGATHILCTASISESVPEWREPSGLGWLTAEYDMLPGATPQRRNRNRLDGRTREIERLIGRSLRACIDFAKLGPRTIHLDCDVIAADGGTRTAAITGVYVALRDAVAFGTRRNWWGSDVLTCAVAAVSVGLVGGQVLVDLNYLEDVKAEVDCNLVMTDGGKWIEVQATGERAVYSDEQLQTMLRLGRAAIQRLLDAQTRALAG